MLEYPCSLICFGCNFGPGNAMKHLMLLCHYATMVINIALEQQPHAVKWVDFMGNPTKVSGGMAANARLPPIVDTVTKGRTVGHDEDLFFVTY